jgi:hypothetical protein
MSDTASLRAPFASLAGVHAPSTSERPALRVVAPQLDQDEYLPETESRAVRGIIIGLGLSAMLWAGIVYGVWMAL